MRSRLFLFEAYLEDVELQKFLMGICLRFEIPCLIPHLEILYCLTLFHPDWSLPSHLESRSVQGLIDQ